MGSVSIPPMGYAPRPYQPINNWQSGPQMYSPGPSAYVEPSRQSPTPWISMDRKPAERVKQRQPKNFWSTEDPILKREEAAKHLCHIKEEVLEQRITFVENILYRSMDLPAHDVRYAEELIEEEKEDEEAARRKIEETHDHEFERHYIGPFGATDKNPEMGWFVDTLRAIRDYEIHDEKAYRYEHFRMHHYMISALAGDWRYFNLDEDKKRAFDLEYQQHRAGLGP